MSTPLGPVVARPLVLGCVTGGGAVRQPLRFHGPPVTHPRTKGRATTGATGSLDGAFHLSVRAHGNSLQVDLAERPDELLVGQLHVGEVRRDVGDGAPRAAVADDLAQAVVEGRGEALDLGLLP
jgi:hypothetical protein